MVALKKSIVIITSAQPSANPRVVKEAVALHNAGYFVTVVYARLSPWADSFDEKLFKETPGIKWISAGCHPIKEPLKYKFVRLRRKWYEILMKYNLFFGHAYEKIFIVNAQALWQKSKYLKADFYIAHIVGALPIAVKTAMKYGRYVAFDAEDYHRGESVENLWYHLAGIKIENYYLPKVKYITAASPLIAEKYRALFPDKEVLVINNVFSKKLLPNKSLNNNEGLHLFWFSQFLGINRGLETIIRAINLLPEYKIKLHLLGGCSENYKNELINLSFNPDNLHFISQVSPQEIFSIASQYDVGMATEIPYNENRNICLTNKLFTYLLAGNCIVASDTLAQKKFMHENAGVGVLYSYDNPNDLAQKLKILYNNRTLLNNFKKNAKYLAATKFNWEAESKKVVDKIKTEVCK